MEFRLVCGENVDRTSKSDLGYFILRWAHVSGQPHK